MGYKKVNDRWECRILNQEPTVDGDDEHDKGDASHSPPPVVPSISQAPSLVAPSTVGPSTQAVTSPRSP